MVWISQRIAVRYSLRYGWLMPVLTVLCYTVDFPGRVKKDVKCETIDATEDSAELLNERPLTSSYLAFIQVILHCSLKVIHNRCSEKFCVNKSLCLYLNMFERKKNFKKNHNSKLLDLSNVYQNLRRNFDNPMFP